MKHTGELTILFLVVIMASTLAQPNYEVGPLTFNISNRGFSVSVKKRLA